jgi:hypothetical protein
MRTGLGRAGVLVRRAALLAPVLLTCCRLRHGCARHHEPKLEVTWDLVDVQTIAQRQATLTIPEGELVVGRGGERWLADPKTGDLRSAPTLAPEDLIAVAGGNVGFRFIGRSGALYTSRSPLGPLERVATASSRAIGAALGEKAIVVALENGDVERSIDAGKTWTKVLVGPREGPVVSLAMVGRRGLAVATPLHVFYTIDDGATWRPVVAPPNVRDAATDRDVLVLHTDTEALRFDPATAKLAHHESSFVAPSKPRETWTAMDDAHALRVSADPVSPTGEPMRNFVADVIGPGGAHVTRKLDGLVGCVVVEAAIRGDVALVACDATQSSKLVRSDDGGRTWVEEVVLGGGMPHRGLRTIALGAGGFVYYAERCAQWDERCSPARVRARAGAPWTDLGTVDEQPDGAPVAFAHDGSDLYEVGTVHGTLTLFRWRPGSIVPELVTTFGHDEGRPLQLSSAGGVQRVVIGVGDELSALEIAGVPRPLALPPKTRRAAFGGKSGLAITAAGLLETTDGARSWHRVQAPDRLGELVDCTAAGCITNRGVRLGWSGAAGAMPEVASKPVWATPFKCRTSGKWVALGGAGQLPDADWADRAGARWAGPTRDAEGTVTVLSSSWAQPPDEVRRTPLMGAAPNGPTDRTLTRTFVQPEGIVATRYVYVRGDPGVTSPVDFSAAWYRGEGRVVRSASRPIGTFRVSAHDPQPLMGPSDTPYERAPYITWLDQAGLWTRTPLGDLRHLADDGTMRSYKVDPESFGLPMVVVDREGTPMIVALNADAGAVLFAMPSDASWTTTTPFAMRGDLRLIPGFEKDHTLVLAGTLDRTPPRAWTIPLPTKSKGELPKAAVLAVIDARAKACPTGAASDDADEFRASLPWVTGARHPVVVDDEGAALVLATDRARVRGTRAIADACVVAFEAMRPQPASPGAMEYGALVVAGDPSRSVLFR